MVKNCNSSAMGKRKAEERFWSNLLQTGICLLAVDEAHCISEWGHDFRPQVSGAISGPHLGEASHRLLRNTLQMKPSTSALLDYPANRYHVPNNHTVDRPRPAGPSGYERGYGQDQNYFHGNFSNPRGTIVNSRSAPSYNEMWKKQNYRAQERYQYQEQYHLQTRKSSLTIKDGPTYQHSVAPLRKPNTLFSPSPQQMPVQYVGQPPRPPTDWIDKPAYENPGMYVIHPEIYENTGMYVRQPEVLSSNVYEKQPHYSKPASWMWLLPVSRKGSVTSALTLNEEKFIEKYVTKYQVTVPEMVQIGLAAFERGRWVLQDVES